MKMVIKGEGNDGDEGDGNDGDDGEGDVMQVMVALPAVLLSSCSS